VTAAAVDQKQLEHEEASVRVEQVRKQIQDTTLTAPFEGRIAVVPVNRYQQVQAGEPILQLESSDLLEVVVHVPERAVVGAREIPRERTVGDVVFGALPERRFPARLVELSTQADPVTRTFQATLAIERPRDVNLLPGMTATLHAPPALHTEAILRIPPGALLEVEGDHARVWVVEPGSFRIRSQAVRLGDRADGMVVVLEGLLGGQEIAVAGLERLEDGMVITPYRHGMLSQ
jgi:membrane fusion protein, multidrug efflux system